LVVQPGFLPPVACRATGHLRPVLLYRRVSAVREVILPLAAYQV